MTMIRCESQVKRGRFITSIELSTINNGCRKTVDVKHVTWQWDFTDDQVYSCGLLYVFSLHLLLFITISGKDSLANKKQRADGKEIAKLFKLQIRTQRDRQTDVYILMNENTHLHTGNRNIYEHIPDPNHKYSTHTQPKPTILTRTQPVPILK